MACYKNKKKAVSYLRLVSYLQTYLEFHLMRIVYHREVTKARKQLLLKTMCQDRRRIKKHTALLNHHIFFFCLLKTLLDWKWKDLYYVGSCQCFVWREPYYPCFWAALCLHNWSELHKILFLVKLLDGHTYVPWCLLLHFLHRSKSSIPLLFS